MLEIHRLTAVLMVDVAYNTEGRMSKSMIAFLSPLPLPSKVVRTCASRLDTVSHWITWMLSSAGTAAAVGEWCDCESADMERRWEGPEPVGDIKEERGMDKERPDLCEDRLVTDPLRWDSHDPDTAPAEGS